MNLGVNSPHFIHHTQAQQQAQVDALHDLGCEWLRISIPWPDVEPVRGKWDWSKTDPAIQLLFENNINVNAILWGFPAWSNGGLPANVATLYYGAWQEYIRSVDSRYGDEVAAFEVGNEQNIHGFMNPPDTALYSILLKSAFHNIVRCPVVVSGGVAGADSAFISTLPPDYCHAVAYHPYPETLCAWSLAPEITYTTGWWLWQKVNRQPQDSYALLSNIVKKPLWATEIGWSTTGWPSVTEVVQAEYLKRSLEVYRALNLTAYFYFQLWDEYPPSAWWMGREAGFGLLRHDFTRKPAFTVYR